MCDSSGRMMQILSGLAQILLLMEERLLKSVQD